MKKRTFTSVATAAALTAAGISITNNLEKKSRPAQHVVQAATIQAATNQTPQQQFLNKAVPAATTAASTYGTYPSVMIAQAAVESAWGQSTLSQAPNNNLFGIKGSYNGQSVSMNTGEYGNNGYYTIDAQFRKYPSYTESFGDNGSLLRKGITGNNSYYSGTWVENTASGTQATQGLQGKYATAPNYASTLNSIIQSNNLTQYDPITTKVNETRTVEQTTPITSAPVDANIIGSIGTAQAGQQVNVSEYITYENGVSHALTNLGWLNKSAFGSAASVTTTNLSAATKTTNDTISNTKATNEIGITTKNTSTKGSNENVAIKQVSNATKVEKTSPVKLSLTPSRKATVQQSTAKESVNNVAVKQNNIVTTNTKTLKVNDEKANIISNTVAKKSTTNETKENPTKVAPMIKVSDNHNDEGSAKVEKHQINKGFTTNTNFTAQSTTNSVLVIKRVRLIYTADGKYGQLGSILSIIDEKVYDGEVWYLTIDGRWIPRKYTEEMSSVASINQNNNFDFANMNIENKLGTLTINYKPNHVVTVWTMPGGKPTGRYLANGTSWRYFRVTKVNNEVWYDLGNNQWVPEKYVYVR